MTAPMRPAPSACPACAAAPAAEAQAARDLPRAQIALSLPTIHCSACISKIERGLDADPRVISARVNLTLKRASIEAAPEVTAEEMRRAGRGAGIRGARARPRHAQRHRDRQRRARSADAACRGGLCRDERDAAVGVGLVGGRGRDARHVPLDFGRDHPAGDRLFRDAVLSQCVVGAAAGAAQHGCADHAGHRAGPRHLAVGNHAVGRACLFRRGARADLLPAGGALSRPPDTGHRALRRRGADGAGSAARDARDRGGRRAGQRLRPCRGRPDPRAARRAGCPSMARS